MSLVKLENISKTYQLGDHQVNALKNIHLQIERGLITAIIGASGSGKSTLMNIIGFLDRPTEGQYLFADQDVSDLDDIALAHIRNKTIGFVFQSFFLLPRLNALQNVLLPLFYRGMERESAIEKATLMLDQMAVGHLRDHKPNQLSGGQQQRVAIARALVTDPDLILADEPTGALDSQTSQDVMDLLVNLNRKEGRTVLIITHDKEVSTRCERVIRMKDGQLENT